LLELLRQIPCGEACEVLIVGFDENFKGAGLETAPLTRRGAMRRSRKVESTLRNCMASLVVGRV
jgi:hypothetical protein